MKIPFYTVLGPFYKRNHRNIRQLCTSPLLKYSNFYVAALGLLGVILSIIDIIRIIKCGSCLPSFLSRDRCCKDAQLISPQAERDFKLICLVLSAEYYSFLLIGLATMNPIFFFPFLTLYALILFIEFLIFFLKVMARCTDLSKSDLVMSLFMTYNWFSVFCTLTRITTGCDI